MLDLITRALFGAVACGLIGGAVCIVRLYLRVLAFERQQRADWSRQQVAYRTLRDRVFDLEDDIQLIKSAA